MNKNFKTIMPIGDQHLPFLHKPTWKSVVELVGLIRPPFIVFMGDLFDMHSFMKFAKRIALSAFEEINDGRLCMEEMLRMIKKASPRSKIFLIKGNHDERAAKRISEKFGADLDAVMIPRDLWSFPDVETIKDPRETLTIQNIEFTHGHYSKLGDHMKNMEYKNVVCGHSHTGGLYYHRINTGEVRWELNVGYIGDPFHEALIYRPLTKYFKWTHGVGLIDYYGPRFIPFNV